jgi:hypothetical protein
MPGLGVVTLAPVDYPLENALFQWEEGWRRLEELRSDPAAYRRAHRVIGAVEEELRRLIGPTYRAAELAALYAQGTDWALDVAAAISPELGDAQHLADAAFWRYLRGARDYAGGRELVAD